MKVTLKDGDCKYTAEDTAAVTWPEALGLVRSVLVSMFPYLTDAEIAEYFTENSWTTVTKKIKKGKK